MNRLFPSVFLAIIAPAGACDEATTNDIASPLSAQYSSWRGFDIGVAEGSSWSRVKTRTTVDLGGPDSYFFASSLPAIDHSGSRNLSAQSALASVQSGYLWQMGAWVMGIEADFDYLNLAVPSFGFETYPCCAPTGFSIAQSIRVHWVATARPRIGVARGRVLYFLTGGVALANLNTAFAFSDNNDNAVAFGSSSHTAAGYALGGGVEAKLSKRISFRADYLLVILPRVSGISNNLNSDSGPSPENLFHFSATFRSNIARLSVHYHF